MAATKYDAMIAALETIQNVTDKPDWMLREEELELREKMHDDELEMSLMMTQIKTGTTDLDNIQDEINNYETQIVDIRARILGTGQKELNDITLPEHKTEAGQKTPEDLFANIAPKYKDQLVTLERSKREQTTRLNKLKARYKIRGEEFGRAAGEEALRKLAAEETAAANSARRLELAVDNNAETTRLRTAAETRNELTFNRNDPATITKDMNQLYVGLQTQVSEEGIFGVEQIAEYAEQLTGNANGHDYAGNADKIAQKLGTLFITSVSAESFLESVNNEDDIYYDFLTETGMISQPIMTQLNMMSLSKDVSAGDTTNVVDPLMEIDQRISTFQPLVRRKQ